MQRAAVFCLILASGCSSPDAFRVIDKKDTIQNDLRRVTTTIQNGESPLNRFIVERIFPANQAPASLRPIILAPGLGFSNRSYTIGLDAGGGDFENSIAANLARGGADVFLYSARQATLAPGAYAEGIDSSAAKEWGLQARVDDFEYIRKQIAAEHGAVKPAVGGVSLGGGTAIAAVNQDPGAYGGLLLIEYSPAVRDEWRPGYKSLCDTVYRPQLAGGQIFETTLIPTLPLLLQLSQTDPNGPSPIPGLPPGLTNRQAYLIVLGTPSMGPPSSVFFPGLVLLTTNVQENRFTYASESVVASMLASANAYTPIAEFADFTCMMGGEKTFTGNLAAFTGPVLAFEAEHGVGAETEVGLPLLGSKNIQVEMVAGFGHADIGVVPDHATRLEKPILDWLKTLPN